MTFWQGVLFQWVNPKAWILVAGGVSTFAPRENFAWNVAVLALLLGLVNLPSICIWAGCGHRAAAVPGPPGPRPAVQWRHGLAAGGVAGADPG